MSTYTTAKRFPIHAVLGKLLKSGISIDYLLSGMGSMLLQNLDNMEDVKGYIDGTVYEMEVKDDKMATTINHGDRVTLKQLEQNELEVGGIYYIERHLGTKFLARLISDEYDWVYDNENYKNFNYQPTSKDKIAKVIKNISYHFPTK